MVKVGFHVGHQDAKNFYAEALPGRLLRMWNNRRFAAYVIPTIRGIFY
jgi:hypothetical protein